MIDTWRILLCRIDDYIFDLKYKLDTINYTPLGELNIDSKNKSRGINYEPTYRLSFLKLLEICNFPKDYTFVDVGSGKGKVLLLALQYGFKRVIGIEFSKELIKIANNNIFRYNSNLIKNSIVNIEETDATDYAIKGYENIFYFFNPFDEHVLINFIKKINRSLNNNFWPVYIIFNNTFITQNISEYMDRFRLYNSFKYGSTTFQIYKNNPLCPIVF